MLDPKQGDAKSMLLFVRVLEFALRVAKIGPVAYVMHPPDLPALSPLPHTPALPPTR